MAFIRFLLEADPYDQAQQAMFEKIESGEEVVVEISGYRVPLKGFVKLKLEVGGLAMIDGCLGDKLHPLP